MKQSSYTFLFIILGISLSACKKSLAPKAYVQWVKSAENGLHKQKEVYPLKLDLLYTPQDYQIVNNLKTNTIKEEVYQKEQDRLGDLQYYHLKLSVVDAEGRLDVGNYQIRTMAEQQKRLGYLSFGMQKDIHLIEEGDTLPCVVYHYEQSYDVKPERSFLVAFDQRVDSKDKTKTFILDSPVFGTGPMKIQIEASDLLNVPYLKIQ